MEGSVRAVLLWCLLTLLLWLSYRFASWRVDRGRLRGRRVRPLKDLAVQLAFRGSALLVLLLALLCL